MEKPLLKVEEKVEDAALQAGGLLRSKYGIWALAVISFTESALPVPIITDPFLIAYVLADKKSVYKGVLVTLAASVLGGVFAYMLAFAFYDFITTQYITSTVGSQFDTILAQLKEGTFFVTLLGAVTPVPYTLVALGAGFLKGSLLLFILASILGRGGRYLLVGYATYKFGEQAVSMLKKRLMLISILSLLVVLVYIVWKIYITV